MIEKVGYKSLLKGGEGLGCPIKELNILQVHVVRPEIKSPPQFQKVIQLVLVNEKIQLVFPSVLRLFFLEKC
jgi:hypothetical protein